MLRGFFLYKKKVRLFRKNNLTYTQKLYKKWNF